MPNLFPENGAPPRYNTADAALLFLNCLWLYRRAAGDDDFLRRSGRWRSASLRSTAPAPATAFSWTTPGCCTPGGPGPGHLDGRAHRRPPAHAAPRLPRGAERLLVQRPAHPGPAGTRRRGGRRPLRRAGRPRGQAFPPGLLDAGGAPPAGRGGGCPLPCRQPAAPQPDLGGVDALYPADPRHGQRRGGQRAPRAVDPLRPAHPCPRRPGVPPRLRRPPAGAGPGLPPGHGVALPLGGYYLAELRLGNFSAEARAAVQADLDLLVPALWEGCAGQLPEIYDGARRGRPAGALPRPGAWARRCASARPSSGPKPPGLPAAGPRTDPKQKEADSRALRHFPRVTHPHVLHDRP